MSMMRAQRYDAELLKAGVGFLPWEGSSYRARRHHGLRLAIIGESHYDPERPEPELSVKADLPSFTRRNVLFRMSQARPVDSFWRRIERLFAVGGAPDDIRGFWESIAFFNFCQDLLSSSADRNLQTHWPRACACLSPQLDALEPDAAIVLGAAAWAGIDCRRSRDTGARIAVPPRFARSASGYAEIWRLNRTGSGVPAIHVAHPMYKGGFKVDEWAPVVNSFLECAVGSTIR